MLPFTRPVVLVTLLTTPVLAQRYNQPLTPQHPQAPTATPAPAPAPAPTAVPAQPAQAAPAAAPASQPATPQGELAQARENLAAVTRKLQAQADTRPELAESIKAVTDAKAAYDQARANAVATLANNPDYKAAQSAAATARQNMNNLAAGGNASPEERITAATAALNAKESLHRIESQALDADPAVQQAQTAYTQATANLTKLREQFANVSQNPEWIAAHDAVEAARTKLAESDRAATEARQAAYQQRAAARAQQRQPQQQPQQQPQPLPPTPTNTIQQQAHRATRQ
jgi:hypothetical protein